MEPTYTDIINPTYPHKLVDAVDEHLFGAQAHKVRELHERLDPVAWNLLKDLLSNIKIMSPLGDKSPEYSQGYRDGYEDGFGDK